MKWFQMERLLTNKYNHLLIVLITIFILSPFVSDRHRVLGVSLLTVLFLGATLIALRAAATASGAIIIGFHVRPSVKARQLAEKDSIDIRSYNVIYDIINDVKAALEGFLEPTLTEKNVGTVEVRQTFKVPKIGLIAGSYVVSGRINRNDKVKIYREDRLIHEGTLSSLKRFKDDVKEVASGFECGVGVERYNDLKVNDVIEAYEIIEEKRTL